MIKIAHIARPVAGVGVYIDLLVKNIDEKKVKRINNHMKRYDSPAIELLLMASHWKYCPKNSEGEKKAGKE